MHSNKAVKFNDKYIVNPNYEMLNGTFSLKSCQAKRFKLIVLIYYVNFKL